MQNSNFQTQLQKRGRTLRPPQTPATTWHGGPCWHIPCIWQKRKKYWRRWTSTTVDKFRAWWLVHKKCFWRVRLGTKFPATLCTMCQPKGLRYSRHAMPQRENQSFAVWSANKNQKTWLPKLNIFRALSIWKSYASMGQQTSQHRRPRGPLPEQP